MNVLLIEPKVRKQHPNVGLLKIGGYHSRRGDRVHYAQGDVRTCPFEPQLVYVSAIFTYYADKLGRLVRQVRRRFPRAEIKIGGVYPSLLPDHVFQTTGIQPHVGLLPEVEAEPPDYTLVPPESPFAHTSVLFTTRGCWRSCKFCSVPTLEPNMGIVENWRDHIQAEHRRVLIYDNNISAQDPKHRAELFDYLAKSEKEVLFDNGFDCTRFDETHADEVASVRHAKVRFALDFIGLTPKLVRAVNLATARGISRARIQVYVIYNFRDTVEDTIARCEMLVELGVQPYPQLYRPYTMTSSREPYIAPGWTLGETRMIRYFYTMPSLYKRGTFAAWRANGCPTLPNSKVNFYSEIAGVRPPDFDNGLSRPKTAKGAQPERTEIGVPPS